MVRVRVRVRVRVTNFTLVVTKQLSASFAISAEAGDILQMAGAFELARSCTAW